MSCHLGHAACKPSTEVQAGDVVLFLSTPHLIAAVEPPTLLADVGVARARDGWGIGLCSTTCVEVA